MSRKQVIGGASTDRTMPGRLKGIRVEGANYHDDAGIDRDPRAEHEGEDGHEMALPQLIMKMRVGKGAILLDRVMRESCPSAA